MSELALIWKELAAIKGILKRSFTEGTVTDVNPKDQTARITIGEGADGKPVKGPWVPYGQWAGAMKGHVPVSVGQQLTMFAPMGDFRRALLLPMTFSDDQKSPSEKGDENVFTFGNFKAEIRGDELVVTVPKVRIVAGDAALLLEDGKATLKGSEVITDGTTKLNKGTRKVVFEGSKDSGGDVNNEGEAKVLV